MRIEPAKFKQTGHALEIVSERLVNGFRATLSLASAGNMGLDFPESAANRKALYQSLEVDGSRVLSLPLRHSKKVLAPRRGEGRANLKTMLVSCGGADGLVLGEKAWLGSVTVADCMPIWMLDSVGETFGILHSGWKGTGILESALQSMTEAFGSLPGDITIVLGPSIGSCCYKVSAERASAFAAEFGSGSAIYRDNGGENAWFLDLGSANIGIAARLGVGTVVDARLCTSCSAELGSFRREGESFTRMLALAGYF
ncbi:MAG: polyphenol oxidase family protein [Spirochaetes bacterium]|nr:polyphenol oxidase family protein [Spirochaetota bacterium]